MLKISINVGISQTTNLSLKLLKHTHTSYSNMPRGNRKENLSTRLAKMPRRGLVPPEEIPGSLEWAQVRQCFPKTYDHSAFAERFFEGWTNEEKTKYLQNCIPRTPADNNNPANESLIDNINRWVDGNGWQYIEGGEYDGSWVNPRYPNRIFQGTTVTLPITGDVSETVEFPIASNDEDPIGLACHFEVSIGGTQTTIKPNKWTDYDSTRTGRKQCRSNMRKARCQKRAEAYAEANKINNPERRANAIAILKAEFHAQDVQRERAKMGIDNAD